MRLLSAVAFMLLLPAISACSGLPGRQPDGPAPLFRTQINEEGSKRFTFEAAPLDTLPTRNLSRRPRGRQAARHFRAQRHHPTFGDPLLQLRGDGLLRLGRCGVGQNFPGFP